MKCLAQLFSQLGKKSTVYLRQVASGENEVDEIRFAVSVHAAKWWPCFYSYSKQDLANIDVGENSGEIIITTYLHSMPVVWTLHIFS